MPTFLVIFMTSILHAEHVDYSLKNNLACSSTDPLGPDCADSAKQNLRKSAKSVDVL
jgi:L-alanine-DL-glutamate epimerase-like enolase superfamily enzyme